MNRLVIIGNGFDLAHGLPTSYGHFIDDYWKSVTSVFNYEKKSSFKDDFIEVNYEFMSSSFDIAIVEYKNINSYAEFNYFIKRYESGYSSYQYTDKNGCSLTFANKFFEIICKKSIENWVDIENVYYEILKGRAKGNYMVNNYPWDIIQLNKEFEDVKNQLEKYLTKNILEKFSFKTEQNNNILNLFEPEIINPQTEEYNKFLNQFPSSKRRYIIEYLKVFDTETSINQMDKFFEKGYNDEVLILDFNYTPTTKPYTDKLFKYFFNPKLIKIHGELQNNQNKLNFGFGDEYDEDYKLIENINNNEYLKNI